MYWWLWIILGFGLLAAELLTPGGFFLFFFGIAGLLVGLLALVGLIEDPLLEWGLFSISAVASLLLFRRRLLDRVHRSRRGSIDSVEGEVAVLLEDLPTGAVGKAELRGTPWSVRALEPVPLVKGQRCLVERVDGLTLLIRPEPTQGKST